MSVTF